VAEQTTSLDDMMNAADARTLNMAGNAFADRGLWNEAIECYERSRARYEQEGDRRGQALVLNNLGAVCYATGDWENALTYYQDALAILRGMSERETELLTLMNICFLEYAQGATSTAELDRAQLLAEELRQDEPLTKICWMRGDAAFHKDTDLPQAFHFYALACLHASRAGGDLLDQTLRYMDEHLRILVGRGESLAALAFCDHLLESGRAENLGAVFLEAIEKKRSSVLTPPQLA
jgi:tetratricopeptide (TPR) repeat protein